MFLNTEVSVKGSRQRHCVYYVNLHNSGALTQVITHQHVRIRYWLISQGRPASALQKFRIFIHRLCGSAHPSSHFFRLRDAQCVIHLTPEPHAESVKQKKKKAVLCHFAFSSFPFWLSMFGGLALQFP